MRQLRLLYRRKMTVEDFLREYSEATLDIMDETYGYHQVKLDGFLNVGSAA